MAARAGQRRKRAGGADVPDCNEPITAKADASFAVRLVQWQKHHGRQTLPWQNTRDPYRIWLSEIMLQQTQVATVIPYYQRFLDRFPNVAALADAEMDEVLTLWSGLGYYSRARNLHHAAQQVAGMDSTSSQEGFPTNRETLETLKGVGRSTAAAIAVFSSGAREAILDGNVKRVLARHYAVEGFPGAGPVEKKLWSLAESLLPERDIEAYTQGLMDLGATLCTRSTPACERCPLASSCLARREGRVAELPTARPKKPLPHKITVMAILIEEGRVLLVKRPPAGIWGGLLCFPEFNSPREALAQASRRFDCNVLETTRLPDLAHGFTHYALTIKPVCYQVRRLGTQAAEAGAVWMNLEAAKHASIPTPVRTLLERLEIPA